MREFEEKRPLEACTNEIVEQNIKMWTGFSWLRIESGIEILAKKMKIT